MSHVENYRQIKKELSEIDAILHPPKVDLKDKDYWCGFIAQILDNGYVNCFNSFEQILVIEEMTKKIFTHHKEILSDWNLIESENDYVNIYEKNPHLIYKNQVTPQFLQSIKNIFTSGYQENNFYFHPSLLCEIKKAHQKMLQEDDFFSSIESFLYIIKVATQTIYESLELDVQKFFINIMVDTNYSFSWHDDTENKTKIHIVNKISDHFEFIKDISLILYDYMNAYRKYLSEKSLVSESKLNQFENKMTDLIRQNIFFESTQKNPIPLVEKTIKELNKMILSLDEMHCGDCTAFPASCMRCFCEGHFNIPGSITIAKSDGYRLWARRDEIMKVLPTMKEASDIEEALGHLNDDNKKMNSRKI